MASPLTAAGAASSQPVLPSGADRAKLFAQLDSNANGRLSYGEVEDAIKRLWPELLEKRVLMAAFRDARSSGAGGEKPSRHGSGCNGTLELDEWEMFLSMLRYYHKLWGMFEALDSSGDKRLNFEEFARGLEMIGLRFHPDEKVNDGYMRKEWKELDTVAEGPAVAGWRAATQTGGGPASENTAPREGSGDGLVLFDDFCRWAARWQLVSADGSAGSGSLAGLGRNLVSSASHWHLARMAWPRHCVVDVRWWWRRPSAAELATMPMLRAGSAHSR
jgi:hypothetical protein